MGGLLPGLSRLLIVRPLETDMPEPETDGARGRRGRGLGGSPIKRGAVAVAAIRVIRIVQRATWHVLEIVLALVILFEEWGWRPLSAALARLAEINLVARLEMWVRVLPPWPALGVFLVPSVLFLPLKLAALWLIAGGHAVAAAGLFIFAKIAGTALYARIFQLTQPALMRLAWFASLYNWFMPWKTALIAHVRQTAIWRASAALKVRAKTALGGVWRQLRPAVEVIARRVRRVLGFD